MRTLLTADYTFLNERLARHYGDHDDARPAVPAREARGSAPLRAARQGRGAAAHVVRRPHVAGAARRVGARQAHGHAADAAAADGVDTISRSRRARSRRRCARGSSSIAPDSVCNGVPRRDRSLRPGARELHRDGQWRDVDREAGAPIDASTELAGGKKVTGPVELTKALLERRDQFVQALTEKLMMYALGRELEYYDMPQVRAIVRRRGARLSVLGARDRDRAQRRVPDAGRRERRRRRRAGVGHA